MLEPEIESQLKALTIEGLPDPVIFGDGERKIVFANEAAVILFEYGQTSKLVGKKIYSLVPEEVMSEKEHDGFYDRFYAGGQTRTLGGETLLQAKTYNNNRVPVGLKLFIIEVNGLKFVGEVIRDRTREVGQEARIREQKVEIETQNRELKRAVRDADRALADTQIALRKNQLQKDIVFWLLSTLSILYILPFFLTVIGVRVPDSLMSLSRDAVIYILGTLSSAIAGIIGYRINEQDKKERDAVKKAS